MADKEAAVAVVESKKEEQATLAMLVELDNVAIPGRKMVYNILKKLLAERDAELTPMLFMHYCIGCCPKTYLPGLLAVMDKKRLSADKMAAELSQAYAESLVTSNLTAPKSLMKLLGKAKDKGLVIGALSGFDEEVATKLLCKLGFDEFHTHLMCVPSATEFPSADAWLRLAKKVGVTRARCTALVSSSHSARSALSGGMRCVAVPDEFTSHQDFGGTDMVLAEITDSAINNIMATAGLAY